MLACVLVIAVADLVIWLAHVPYAAEALFDEPAHAAIGILALAAVAVSISAPVVIAMLAGSLLIDLDHLPDVLGSNVLEHGVPRPYTHSLLTVVVVLAVALLLRDRTLRRLALVVAVALCLHFVRDMAEPHGPGVSLLWPLSDRPVTLAYGWWAGLVALLALLAFARRIRLEGVLSRARSHRRRPRPSAAGGATTNARPGPR